MIGDDAGERDPGGESPAPASAEEPLVVFVRGEGLDGRVVGGKAAALDRLVAMGAPVPPTAVVTTAAYREFVRHNSLGPFLAELAGQPPGPGDDQEADRRRVEEAFLAASVPPRVAEAVGGAAGQVGGGGSLAIRSSATSEDAEAASFAGQYRSFLCVEPGEELLRALRLTWASLWGPNVRAYRAGRGLEDEGDLAMAVVMMRMVEAEHAGVVFTVAPGGEHGQLRVELVEGLAEDLVSGGETPSAFTVAREGHRSFPEPLAPVLEPLVRLALDVERQFGAPQDIEWAHDGKHLFLVQARPITVLEEEAPDDDGFDTADAGDRAFTPAGIGEMLPGVLPPLVWTINAPLLDEAFRSMFDELGALPDLSQPMVARFRGRAALNLDVLRSVAERMPGNSPAELERQYFGKVISEDADTEPSGGGLRALLPVLRALRVRGRLREEAGVVRGAIDELVDLAVDIDRLDVAALAAYGHRLRELGARSVAAEVGVAALAAASYRALELFLERHVGEQAGELAQSITSGAAGGAGALADEMRTVADEVRNRPQLRDLIIEERDVESLVRRLRSFDEGRELLDRMARALRRAGSRAVFAGATWEEEEGRAWSALRQALQPRRERPGRKPPDEVLADLEARLSGTWRWRMQRLATGQIVDLRIRLLRRLAADACHLLRLREETKASLLRLGGETRRVIEALGRFLVEQGRLERPEDVDYLSDNELEALVAGDRGPGAGELRRRRAAAERAAQAGALPLRFEGRPGTAASEAADGDVLEGWGASPGTHAGPVRVVRDPRAADVDEGDVLVAQATDPSWTPLFLSAGAIVVEEGGPLSHAAIVARELGLPAVLHVPGAVDRLEGVPTVTVDGTAGRVVCESDGDDGRPGAEEAA